MGLLKWQIPYADRLEQILREHQSALVALPTGAGKTYIGCEVARRVGRRLLVVCPKTVISSWKRVSVEMQADLVLATNPESRALREYFRDNKWHLPADTLFIHDEVHRGASGANSKQTKMFGLLKAYPDVKVLMQSATAADNPMKMRYIGFMLGLHSFNTGSFWDWCRKNGCFKSPYHNGMEFPKGERGRALMAAIHHQIKHRMISATFDDIPDFPECSIETVLVDVQEDDLAKIRGAYELVKQKVSGYSAEVLPQLAAARQLSEVAKIGIMADMVEDLCNEGNSVVVFLNFHLSIDSMVAELHGKGIPCSVIDGRVKDRESARLEFQNDRIPVLVCQVSAGGVGISLHADKPGLRPRVSLICPSYSAPEMVQCLGRIWRTGSHHKAVQKFVLTAGTVEEKIKNAIDRKTENIGALQDADFA